MLAKDSVKKPAATATTSGLSYTEFSYMLLQAYDFVHLHDALAANCRWAAATSGATSLPGSIWPAACGACSLRHDLAAADQVGRHENGQDRSGAVWLSAERTSPYQFYQYWINVRRPTPAAACGCSPNCRTRKSNRSTRPAERPAAGKPAAAGRGTDAAGARRRRLWPRLRRRPRSSSGPRFSDLNDAQLTEIFADVPSANYPVATWTKA